MSDTSIDSISAFRAAQRARLLTARAALVADAALQLQFATHLMSVLRQLMPERLGIYSAVRSEFDAAAVCVAELELADIPFALPFSSLEPRRMDFRHWDRQPLTSRDECRILTSDGPLGW
jgi:5-formyltetrahydrofolate cyclo-ligase